ncbi:MAG TPA: 4-hydroxythreonine-4-phosphate dehydrogenase PdxA [Polyangiaceae bacterium]|nr:4-hydroxythreonine-4-phosphate dehydrogenase PdxA [Polyangiaceae bacterium]
MLVVSIGCPASVGPEVSLAAARRLPGDGCVLVGSELAIRRAAELVGVSQRRLQRFDGQTPQPGRLSILDVGPELTERDLDPQRPTKNTGRSQLAAVDAAFDLVRKNARSALVTGPVSKALIARSGAHGAEKFKGHTEWLQARDGAPSAIMCFASPKLTTSLASTHLPLAQVPSWLSPDHVAEATIQLAFFLRQLGQKQPRLAICSLNPHAGESELLGDEERRAIVPGIGQARRRLRNKAILTGPIGAESAYRLAYAGAFDGVVAMYHDQATIPTKLIAFGDAVNVTLGLSRVRTSVDHGTAYDIAWQGKADPSGMRAALRLAQHLVQ